MASTNHFNCEVVECPICMLDIDTTNNRVTTECGHAFHTKCLLSNVAFNGFGCPYCRSEMVEESVANHNHEDDEDNDEDDDSDEDEDDEDEDEDDPEEIEQHESDMLRGFRFMLERTTGEILTNGDDIDEENEYENELNRKEEPRPPIDLIVKKLSEAGVTFTNLIKILLLEHPEYHDDHEDLSKLNDALYDEIRDIINNYSPQEEEELLQEPESEPQPQLEEDEPLESIETLTQDLLTVPIQDDFNFYFLENDFIEKCKQTANINLNTNTFFMDEEPNYSNYLLEDEFITSIIECVY